MKITTPISTTAHFVYYVHYVISYYYLFATCEIRFTGNDKTQLAHQEVSHNLNTH